ncbi:MAG: glycine cleavage system protein GcvH [Candidatus Hodarchaeales archaeon]|jgi:glycine cleavage system H protein
MSYKVPEDLKYSEEHEWVKIEGDLAIIGITDYAQAKLTDVVFVELPEPGEEIETGTEFGSIESVKSVSDLVAPISGEIAEKNDELDDAPEKVNTDPYSSWMIKVQPSNLEDDMAALMDAEGYKTHCESLDAE